MKTIKVNKRQYIGGGCFGDVYRISSRRVVKVFHLGGECESEIKGSKLSKYALPILERVKVKRGNKKFDGVIKRYIPYECDIIDYEVIRKKLKKYKNPSKLLWDLHINNIRKDSRGRIYIIDTGTGM